eukprot:216955-Alexandrium_andersonii.AAC.1
MRLRPDARRPVVCVRLAVGDSAVLAAMSPKLARHGLAASMGALVVALRCCSERALQSAARRS